MIDQDPSLIDTWTVKNTLVIMLVGFDRLNITENSTNSPNYSFTQVRVHIEYLICLKINS